MFRSGKKRQIPADGKVNLPPCFLRSRQEAWDKFLLFDKSFFASEWTPCSLIPWGEGVKEIGVLAF